MRYSGVTRKASQTIAAITCAMLLIFECHTIKAQPKQTQTVPSVKLDIGTLTPGGSPGDTNVVLPRLSAALKRSPKARFFRLNWDFDLFSFGSTSIILYDRLKHTLRFDYNYGHNAAGNPKDNGVSRLLFTGVTEAIISRAAKAHTKDIDSDDKGYILDLTQFGCVSHVLRSPTPKRRSHR